MNRLLLALAALALLSACADTPPNLTSEQRDRASDAWLEGPLSD